MIILHHIIAVQTFLQKFPQIFPKANVNLKHFWNNTRKISLWSPTWDTYMCAI